MEPLERFVETIVILWLFDIFFKFKPFSRSSERLTKA